MLPFLVHFSYLAIAAWLLLSGFGLPFPEDVPLLLAGAMCSEDAAAAITKYYDPTGAHQIIMVPAKLWIMLPLCFLCILGADCILYWLGRRYGHHVPRFKLLRHYLTPQRLAAAEKRFHGHSGKTMFLARFMPGLRTPIFFTAGTFKVPFWKMVVCDGSAATLSVPLLILLGWKFADHLARLKERTREAQYLIAALVILAVLAVVVYRLIRRKRKSAVPPAPPPPQS
jgi:membrane protein DedA with SNARE-associated domain